MIRAADDEDGEIQTQCRFCTNFAIGDVEGIGYCDEHREDAKRLAREQKGK